jgi:FkbM family methyltransferase
MAKDLVNDITLRVLRRFNRLTNSIKIFKVNLHGKRWLVPYVDGIGYGASGLETEPWIYLTLLNLHKSKKINAFLDIGINLGQTLIKIKSIDKEIFYFGFDPNPNCIFYVDYLSRLNNLIATESVCVGLGQHKTFLDLKYEGIEDTRATVVDVTGTFRNHMYYRKVPIYPLDDLNLHFEKSSNIVLKVDVEGFELEVFLGAEKFLTTFSPTLLFEVLPHHEKEEIICKQRNIYTYLIKHGYIISRIEQDAQLHSINAGFQNKDDYSKVDYLAIPQQLTRNG